MPDVWGPQLKRPRFSRLAAIRGRRQDGAAAFGFCGEPGKPESRNGVELDVRTDDIRARRIRRHLFGDVRGVTIELGTSG